MKCFKVVVSTLLPLLVAASLSQGGLEGRREGFNLETLSVRNETTSSDKNDTIIVERCRAQEVSAGAALNILLVLATGSVMHMPGALIYPKSTLYRLAPELGLVELILILVAIGDAIFIRQYNVKAAVTGVLARRHQGQFRNSPAEMQMPIFESTDEYEANAFVNRLQRFGLGRILSDALVVLAFVKSTAIKGTIRTNVVAASYALPFFTLEILSLAALRLDPRPRTRAQAAVEVAGINSLARSQHVNRRGRIDFDPNGPQSWRYKVLVAASFLVFGLPALMNGFWPFGVPGFIFYDFREGHSANGRWWFSYSTWLVWAFWIWVVGVAAALPLLLLRKVPAWKDRYLRLGERLSEFWPVRDPASAYAVLKFAVIVKFYVTDYTGIGTVKPNWLDWHIDM